MSDYNGIRKLNRQTSENQVLKQTAQTIQYNGLGQLVLKQSPQTGWGGARWP
jgi:hypothetical protein